MGGELFDMVIERKHFTEADAASITAAVLSVMQHCHSKGIIHRGEAAHSVLLQRCLARSAKWMVCWGDYESGGCEAARRWLRIHAQACVLPSRAAGAWQQTVTATRRSESAECGPPAHALRLTLHATPPSDLHAAWVAAYAPHSTHVSIPTNRPPCSQPPQI